MQQTLQVPVRTRGASALAAALAQFDQIHSQYPARHLTSFTAHSRGSSGLFTTRSYGDYTGGEPVQRKCRCIRIHRFHPREELQADRPVLTSQA